MATAQWQVFDSSKDETHCSSPERPSSTSFHGVVGRPAGSPDICESPPRQPDQVCRSASNQSASTHSGQPRRTCHKEPGRHRRLSTGYSGPRGCACPRGLEEWRDRGGGFETSVCLIRFQFTGTSQTENGLQSHGRREEVRDPSGAGVNAYLGRVTDRGLPLPVVVDTPQGSHKAGCAGVGAGLRTGLSC